MKSYHTAIIGAGSGGLTVAVGLAKLGKKVALIERHRVGGDCTNVGCIPSKSLIHLAKSQERTGVLEAVRDKRDRLREEEEQWLEEMPNLDLLLGEARFRDPHTLSVDGSSVKAQNFVIATGSKPRPLPILGLSPDRVLSNESLFEIDALPAHLAIVGGGVITVEMAPAFAKLGAKVTIIGRHPRILPQAEDAASEMLLKSLERLGVHCLLGATVREVQQSNVLVSQNGKTHQVPDVDKVLVAVGRVPNLDLDLRNAGVVSTEAGIPTDSLGRSNVSHIFAIGDVNLNSAFTHTANHQGRRLVMKLAFPLLPMGSEPSYPWAVFSDPVVAQVGPILPELHQRYHSRVIKSVRFDLRDTDRGYTDEIGEGFVLLHALRGSGKLLSATVVAPQAEEMLPLLAYAVNQQVSVYRLANLVFPYPCLSEAIKKAADRFATETFASPWKEFASFLAYRWRSPRLVE